MMAAMAWMAALMSGVSWVSGGTGGTGGTGTTDMASMNMPGMADMPGMTSNTDSARTTIRAEPAWSTALTIAFTAFFLGAACLFLFRLIGSRTKRHQSSAARGRSASAVGLLMAAGMAASFLLLS